MNELSAHDAHALPDNHIHFGFRDKIAQPTVMGAPPRKCSVPDNQPVVNTGEFLLGYTNEYGSTYSVQPLELSTNSSYSSFRILEQDVPGFERFLTTYAAQAKSTPRCWPPRFAVAGERESTGAGSERAGNRPAVEQAE